jgi:hypothetical protein
VISSGNRQTSNGAGSAWLGRYSPAMRNVIGETHEAWPFPTSKASTDVTQRLHFGVGARVEDLRV